jgi:hypothetical protein
MKAMAQNHSPTAFVDSTLQADRNIANIGSGQGVGTPMEHVNLRHASVEEIHQVAEKDAKVVWSLMHLPDPITQKVSTITHNDVEEKAATFRVYARLHHLEGDDAAAYVDWALNRLDKLRPKEHH